MTTINKDTCFNLDQSIQPEKSTIANWLNGSFNKLSNAFTAMKNRRAVKPLLYASEHELADMGLTSEDVRFIRMKGPFFDPTPELQRRSHYRSRDMEIRL